MKTFTKGRKNIHVLLNTTAIAYINRMGGPMSQPYPRQPAIYGTGASRRYTCRA